MSTSVTPACCWCRKLRCFSDTNGVLWQIYSNLNWAFSSNSERLLGRENIACGLPCSPLVGARTQCGDVNNRSWIGYWGVKRTWRTGSSTDTNFRWEMIWNARKIGIVANNFNVYCVTTLPTGIRGKCQFKIVTIQGLRYVGQGATRSTCVYFGCENAQDEQ